MMPVSGVNTNALQPLTAPEKADSQLRPPEEENRSPRPSRDEYVPEEQQEPSGRYWLGKDEDGQPKIFFDGPAQAAEGAQKKPEGASKPDAAEGREGIRAPERKSAGNKEETCTGNTDQVDREIEALKKKQAELKQQLSAETDEAAIRELKQELSQVERELRQKDNDAYRRQHTVFS